MGERQAALGVLADPPQDGWTVLSNARCLSEGVDVPAVDGVVFASPKGSEIDIVRAVGRTLRRNPRGSGIATILVPVLLPEDPDHATDDYDEWATVCRVVRALRAHDTMLGAQLDEQRTRTASGDSGGAAALTERILVRLPDGYGMRDVLRHITVRVRQDTTSSRWASFGELRAFMPRTDISGYPTARDWVTGCVTSAGSTADASSSQSGLRRWRASGSSGRLNNGHRNAVWPLHRRSTPSTATSSSRKTTRPRGSTCTRGWSISATATRPERCQLT